MFRLSPLRKQQLASRLISSRGDAKSRDGRKIGKQGKGGKVQRDGSLHHEKLNGDEVFPAALDKGDPNYDPLEDLGTRNSNTNSFRQNSGDKGVAIDSDDSRTRMQYVNYEDAGDMVKVERLLDRQRDHLPSAIQKMRTHGKKVGHWAWWAFPTELEGASEPSPPSCVTKVTALRVLAEAPDEWREVLELVCDLGEAHGKSILPSVDHGRVKFFIPFWEDVLERAGGEPSWLARVLARLKPIYGAPPTRRRSGNF